MEFVPFPKIPRLKREVCITEKLDGTNAQLCVFEACDQNLVPLLEKIQKGAPYGVFMSPNKGLAMLAGSRNRWLGLTKEQDNHGFCKWAAEHAEELFELGVGQHFGEWWGQGIGRGYGMTEKRFSLFNVHRWADGRQPRPACCDVVPTLGWGAWTLVDECLARLREQGSVAAPGCMNPEGIIIYHAASRMYFKATLDKDDLPKGAT